MLKRMLGRTGLTVTELCFGALPLGPLQANISAEDAVALIRKGFESGINFVDTAESYQTQSYVGEAIRQTGADVVVATKSAATTYADMEKSIERSLRELGRDVIDIYHLHAARVSASVFTEREGALACLLKAKETGKIRAVGISTHGVDVVLEAAQHPEVDVVFPLINQTGMGILNGTRDEMIAAIGKVHAANKGIYAMKALSGGHLIDDIKGAFRFVRDIPGMTSVAVGMVHPDELAMNLQIFSDDSYEPILPAETKRKRKRLMVMGFCIGCGRCVSVCPSSALSLKDGKAVVDPEKCILCGYCSPGCPMFALRLI